MEKLNLIRLADIKEYLPMLEREEITKSRFAELLNISANKALNIHNVVSSGNPKPKHKGKWKCKLCGRDTFDTKTPHKCVSGYTKRGLIWEEVE